MTAPRPSNGSGAARVRRLAIVGCLVGWLLATAPGCLSVGGPSAADLAPFHGTATGPPAVALTYYPYGECFDRRLGAPHPPYGGWTDRRMARDVQLLAQAGVQRLLVQVAPTELTPDRTERYQTFLALAGKTKDAPLMALAADCAGLSSEQFQRFLAWCQELGLFTATAYDRAGGLPVVELVNSQHLREVSCDFLALRHVVWEQPESFRKAGALRYVQQTPDHQRVRVYAAALDPTRGTDRENWLVPRHNGRSLAAALESVQVLQPAEVVVESWNNYLGGSFIEPNSRDGDQLERVLAHALKRWAQPPEQKPKP